LIAKVRGRQNVSERAHIASFGVGRLPTEIARTYRIFYHYLDDVECIRHGRRIHKEHSSPGSVNGAQIRLHTTALLMAHPRVRIFISDASFSMFAFAFSEKQHGAGAPTPPHQARTPTNQFHLPSIVQSGQGRQGFRAASRGKRRFSSISDPSNPFRTEGNTGAGGIRSPPNHCILTPCTGSASHFL
jgi:hypothetical protein